MQLGDAQRSLRLSKKICRNCATRELELPIWKSSFGRRNTSGLAFELTPRLRLVEKNERETSLF